MKTFEKLESLRFFDWLSESHNIRDTDMKPEYLDELPLNDIHRTVANSMAFRWFREKYDLNYVIVKAESWFFTINGCNTQEGFNTYEEAELACLRKLIEIHKSQL
jgi:hypothetical protein